jgi:carbon monoxide dehydrogenase subunit G
MKLEQRFEVDAPVDVVWAALIDLERVAPCLPGADITERDEEGVYHGTFQVKLGPTTAAYRGTIRIDEADEGSHTATFKAKGTDKRGQGGATATIVNRLSEHERGTQVHATTDFTITGRLARFGRGGMMQDISNRLLRDFSACLATRLGESAPAPPAEGEAAGGGVDEGAPGSAPPPPAAPPPAPAAPVQGGSLFFSVLLERIKRLFRRG